MRPKDLHDVALSLHTLIDFLADSQGEARVKLNQETDTPGSFYIGSWRACVDNYGLFRHWLRRDVVRKLKPFLTIEDQALFGSLPEIDSPYTEEA